MKRQLLLGFGLAVCFCASAQTKSGGISPQMLQQIQQQNPPTASDRALRNALAVNAIDALAQNHEHAGALDTYFSVETKKQSITDQKSSGRCWMFSGLNVLRSNFAKRTDSLTVTLSQDYLFFWDQLEKANLMLQGVIDTGKKPIDDQRVQFFFHYPLNDGGTFCGVAANENVCFCVNVICPTVSLSFNSTRIRRLSISILVKLLIVLWISVIFKLVKSIPSTSISTVYNISSSFIMH